MSYNYHYVNFIPKGTMRHGGLGMKRKIKSSMGVSCTICPAELPLIGSNQDRESFKPVALYLAGEGLALGFRMCLFMWEILGFRKWANLGGN